jgi:hypothetical protein
MLATAERGERQAQLRGSDEQLLKRMNGAIREGHKSGDGLKALDRVIRESRSEGVSLAAAEPASTVKMLDTPAVRELGQGTDKDAEALAAARRVLDALNGRTRTLDAPAYVGDSGPAFEARLKRARAVKSGTYDDDRGRKLFKEHDSAANERGEDLVANLERVQSEWQRAGIIGPGGKV